MNFSVSSSLLSSRLQTIGRVIASKNSIPLLDCFLFVIKGSELIVTASDGETTIKTTLPLTSASEDFDFAINARTIQDAIKEIPDQPLSFEVNKETFEIEVNYQNGKYNLIALSGAEYPSNQPEIDGHSIDIESDVLLRGITRALFATADDTLRPVMNGVYFDFKPDALTMVASDGHKLVCDKSLNTKADITASFILPKKPALMLKSLIGKEKETATLNFNDRLAEVQLADYRMNCRLIDGHYPNYASVIPTDNPNIATINRTMLLGALRRVLIFSSQSNSLIKMQFSTNQLTISSQDIDFSRSAKEDVGCEYGSIPLSIGFKGTSLIDILSNIDSEDVLLKLGDPSRAGVFVPVTQNEGEDLLMLLMPMMLND